MEGSIKNGKCKDLVAPAILSPTSNALLRRCGQRVERCAAEDDLPKASVLDDCIDAARGDACVSEDGQRSADCLGGEGGGHGAGDALANCSAVAEDDSVLPRDFMVVAECTGGDLQRRDSTDGRVGSACFATGWLRPLTLGPRPWEAGSASHRSVQLKKEPRLLGPRVPLFALEPSPTILEFVSDFLQDPSCHAVALVTEAEELEWYRTIVQSSDSGLALTLLVPKGLLQAERGAFAEATWTDLRVPGDWRRRVRITTLAAAHFSDDGMLTACSRRSLLMPLVPLLLVAKLCSLAFGWGPQ
eukprot:s3548_g8.t1